MRGKIEGQNSGLVFLRAGAFVKIIFYILDDIEGLSQRYLFGALENRVVAR